jgi:site-specific DNA-methyltransferase (adenine-specific)
MELMRSFSDKYFELAVVDPPYGIKADRSFVRKTPAIDPRNGRKILTKPRRTGNWDNNRPDIKYFNELIRVSKNQIIWGGNYFADLLPAKSCWIVWDKVNGGSDQADCELAWTSFNTAVRQIEYMWCIAQGKSIENGRVAEGNNKLWEIKLHPTQKPVKLYDWIFKNYLPNGGKVLDTHGGSMSSVISAIKSGNIEMTCSELDKDYFKAAKERILTFQKQLSMFDNPSEVIFYDNTPCVS